MSVVLVVAGIGTPAFAVTGSAKLTVQGTINGSISITLSTSAGTFTEQDNISSTIAFGNIGKYGSVPSGCAITRTSTSWTLSWTVNALVEMDGLVSASYSGTMYLAGGAPASGVSWNVLGFAVGPPPLTTIITAGSYGSTAALSYQLTILDSTPLTATVNNTTVLGITAN